MASFYKRYAREGSIYSEDDYTALLVYDLIIY